MGLVDIVSTGCQQIQQLFLNAPLGSSHTRYATLAAATAACCIVSSSSLMAFLTFRKQYKVHKTGIIVVTGSSSGIGKHATEYLAAKLSDFTVYAGVRKQSDADKITALGVSNLKPLLLDVSSHQSCVDAMEVITADVAKTGRPLVAVVNNAGVSRVAACEYHRLDDMRAVFDTNFFGAVDLTQLALPLLRASSGRVIMTSSILGRFGT
mgnify:FL=1